MSELLPTDIAVSQWLTRWYNGIYATSPAIAAYADRGIAKSIVIAPSRMIDDAQALLDAYRKNDNSPTMAQGSLLPIVIACTSKDYTLTTGDWGGRQLPRKLVRIVDTPDASYYGYRQAMYDIRLQLAFFAPERSTATSLVAQFGMFISDPANRVFYAEHTFGQYAVQMPIMIENPDIIASNVPPDGQKNLTILTVDIGLKATIPYFDAPKTGEENDGSLNVPKGYPVVNQINCDNVTIDHQFSVSVI